MKVATPWLWDTGFRDRSRAAARDGLYRWPCGKCHWPRSLCLFVDRRPPGHHRRAIRYESRAGSSLCGDSRGRTQLGRAGPDSDRPANRVRGGVPWGAVPDAVTPATHGGKPLLVPVGETVGHQHSTCGPPTSPSSTPCAPSRHTRTRVCLGLCAV